MTGGIQYYPIGKDALQGLMHLSYELGMPDDTVNFLHNCHGDIEEIINALGTDRNSEHFDNEQKFRQAMLQIKNVFEESIDCIEKMCEECEDILTELDDVLDNEAYDEFFLRKYQEDSA